LTLPLGGRWGPYPVLLRILPWQLFLQTIKAGEGIIASNQSANRDEDVFPDPDKFNLHRKVDPAKNLAFGFGDHRCIAEALARAELETVFGE
jgi:nitric oxide reductase